MADVSDSTTPATTESLSDSTTPATTESLSDSTTAPQIPSNITMLGQNATTIDLTVTNTVTHNFVAFSISNVSVIPYVSASLYMMFITSKNVVLSRMVTLTGDDYFGWGSDDGYLTTYVSKNIDTIFSQQ